MSAKNVSDLIRDAGNTTDPCKAMQFSQAAVNCANAMAALRSLERDELVTKIRSVFDVLDSKVGDTDPAEWENLTDDELKQEYPLFWCCRQLSLCF